MEIKTKKNLIEFAELESTISEMKKLTNKLNRLERAEKRINEHNSI